MQLKGLIGIIIFFCSIVASASTGRIEIVASFSVLESLVRELVPSVVSVRSLVPVGKDAHHYEFSARDLAVLKKASLIFSMGAGFEPWLPSALKASQSKVSHVVLTDKVVLLRAGHHGRDPHLWLAPLRTIEMVKQMGVEIRRVIPKELAADVSKREEFFILKLQGLHEEIQRELSVVPAHRRRVVTSHQAFGYFQEAYGVEFMAPQGWSTEIEPTAKEMARIIRDLKSRKVQALLRETLASPQTLQQIGKEAGVAVGGPLMVDSLSSEAPDYLSMMRHNLRVLLEALKAKE